MARVSRIRVHPIKSLNPIDVDSAAVQNGGLEYDRKYAIFDENDTYVNGKRNERVYRLRLDFDTDAETATLWVPNERDRRTFHMQEERSELEAWLSEFFDEPVTVVESTDTRFTDAAGGLGPSEITAPGPSIASEETFREIASWFPQLDEGGVRRRFRTNLEIEGVPPFWEDRLYADKDHVVVFRIGDVRLYGIMPLPRCNVPARDPETGELDAEFTNVFLENRERTFPSWGDPDQLGDHLPDKPGNYFYLTVVTRIPSSEDGTRVRIGDEVEIIGEEAVIKSH